MKKFTLHIANTILCTAVYVSSLYSCAADESFLPDIGNKDAIIVSAEIAQELATRGNYQEEGDITTGTYYLTYPAAPNGNNAVATVDFDKEGTKGLGIVTTPDGDELNWTLVGNGANPFFYLDNVQKSLDKNNGSDPITVTFGDNNPYIAALYDTEEGKNDLLWGKKQVQRNDKNISFDLHHYMSRIRVEITADETNASEGDLDLSNAEVGISSIVHTPVSYNRLDGSLYLGDNPAHSSLIIVNTNNENAQIGWAKIKKVNDKVTQYITKDFVLPPQGLLEDENRPKLIIRLKDSEGKIKKTYSGILPHAMEIIYPEDKEHPYPVSFYFLKEHIITIRTKITEAPPELAFMPVQVIEWVDKGNFTLEGHQAGIYLAKDFTELISYYGGENGKYNEFQLARYGYIKGDKWVFNIFSQIELEKSEIAGKMKVTEGKKDYSFDFHGYTIYVKDGNNTPKELKGLAGEQELYRIVSGE